MDLFYNFFMSAYYGMEFSGYFFWKIFLIAIKFTTVLHKGIRRYAQEELWGKSYSSRQNGFVHTFFAFS
jgi:hypothetical protein